MENFSDKGLFVINFRMSRSVSSSVLALSDVQQNCCRISGRTAPGSGCSRQRFQRRQQYGRHEPYGYEGLNVSAKSGLCYRRRSHCDFEWRRHSVTRCTEAEEEKRDD
jgi:hypothetical protein